jgi:hypothetical protein
MSDFEAIADRVEIEALRGEFTDAVMMHDYDRFATLFTEDAVVRIPDANIGFTSREELRAGIERLHHDRYQRTPDGWKFAERVYEVRYVDSAPLTGSAPG